MLSIRKWEAIMKKYITVIVCVLLLLSACSNSKDEVSHKDTVTIKKTFEYKEKIKIIIEARKKLKL